MFTRSIVFFTNFFQYLQNKRYSVGGKNTEIACKREESKQREVQTTLNLDAQYSSPVPNQTKVY